MPQAVRPYLGPTPPGMRELIDYLNREIVPAVKRTRDAVNEVFLPVVDNAPSTNPLGYYFATETASGDPGPGRARLNATPQNTGTVLTLSQENGRLHDVAVFLDIMSGSATLPLGIVTLVDSINPGRFIRFDLTAVTDQGAYWELTVDPTESSHDDPFVDGEGVVLAFMPGVGSTPATVPIGAIAPALAGAAGDGLVWDAGNLEFDVGAGDGIDVAADSVAVDVTDIVDNVSITEVATNNIQRAALTGAVAAAAGSNATVFSGIRDNGAAENDRTNLNNLSTTSIIAIVTDDAGNDELEITHQRAALTGVIDAAQNSNATTSAEPFVTYSASANMSAERVTTSSTSVTVSTAVASQIEFQRAALTGAIAATANSNATLFAGIRDNGATETDRTNLNFLNGTGVTLTVTDDAGNDELEIAAALATIADDNFLANVSGAPAAPSPKTFTSLAGTGLAYNATTHALDSVRVEPLTLRFTWSSATSGQPAAGVMRASNAAPNANGELAFRQSSTDLDGRNVSQFLLDLDPTDSSQASMPRGMVIIQTPNDPSETVTCSLNSVTGDGLTIHMDTSPMIGGASWPWANGETLLVQFIPAMPSFSTAGSVLVHATGATDANFMAYANFVNEIPASLTAKGTVELATSGEVAAGTDTDRAVTPGAMVTHNGVVKCWGQWAGNSATFDDSYNLSSIVDSTNGTTVNVATDFANSNWVALVGTEQVTSNTAANSYVGCIGVGTRAAGQTVIRTFSLAATPAAGDPGVVFFLGIGDQ